MPARISALAERIGHLGGKTEGLDPHLGVAAGRLA